MAPIPSLPLHQMNGQYDPSRTQGHQQQIPALPEQEELIPTAIVINIEGIIGYTHD